MPLCYSVVLTNCPENKQPWIFTLTVPSKMFQCSGTQNALGSLQSPFDTEPKLNYSG